MKKIDLTGQRFGYLKVLEEAERNKNHHIFWSCRCDCGKVVPVRGSCLRSGETRSCGCWKPKQKGKNMGRIKTQNWNKILGGKNHDEILLAGEKNTALLKNFADIWM